MSAQAHMSLKTASVRTGLAATFVACALACPASVGGLAHAASPQAAQDEDTYYVVRERGGVTFSNIPRVPMPPDAVIFPRASSRASDSRRIRSTVLDRTRIPAPTACADPGAPEGCPAR
ncbi:MAG: hypothetical protein GC151_18575 [Betaproteobacteria bacterium]|nr:hypothetical protein [Betaproteobacteria bacterium]